MTENIIRSIHNIEINLDNNKLNENKKLTTEHSLTLDRDNSLHHQYRFTNI